VLPRGLYFIAHVFVATKGIVTGKREKMTIVEQAISIAHSAERGLFAAGFCRFNYCLANFADKS
jgi:hypothetical protein